MHTHKKMLVKFSPQHPALQKFQCFFYFYLRSYTFAYGQIHVIIGYSATTCAI